MAVMSGHTRLLSFFCLLSTAVGLTNSSTTTTSSFLSSSDNGAIVLQPNRMGIPGLDLPLPNLLSSILGSKPTTSPATPQVTPFFPQSTTPNAAVPATQQNGNPGVLGGLLSALGGLLPPVTNIVPAVPTINLPVPGAEPTSGNGDALGELLTALGGVLGPLTDLPNILPPVVSITAPPSLTQLVAGGDSGALGALLSGLEPIISALTDLPNVATSVPNPAAIPASAIIPLEPLLTVLSEILSAPAEIGGLATELPQVLPPLVPILTQLPALISEIIPEIPQLTTELPVLMPLLDSLESILNSNLAAVVPQVADLTSAFAAEVSALSGQVFSGTSLAIAQIPVLTVDLSSISVPVPIPSDIVSQLSGVTLPSKAPLSELAADLANLVGPANTGLVEEIVEALAATLDNVVLGNDISSLVQVTVAAGSTTSVVTEEWCSKLSMIGGSLVMVSVTCGPTVATTVSVPASSAAAPVTVTPFTDVPFAEPSSSSVFSVPAATGKIVKLTTTLILF